VRFLQALQASCSDTEKAAEASGYKNLMKFLQEKFLLDMNFVPSGAFIRTRKAQRQHVRTNRLYYFLY